jgi:hypothetical protein
MTRTILYLPVESQPGKYPETMSAPFGLTPLPHLGDAAGAMATMADPGSEDSPRETA